MTELRPDMERKLMRRLVKDMLIWMTTSPAGTEGGSPDVAFHGGELAGRALILLVLTDDDETKGEDK